VIYSVILVVFSLGNIAAPLMGISKAASAATDFFAIIDAPAPRTDGLKEPDVSVDADISFNGVTFSYPSRPGVKVLDNLNLLFPTGKLTAIVGPSGCGKSTIVGLLERWYQITDPIADGESLVLEKTGTDESGQEPDLIPNSGIITVGTHNIEDLDLKWWRTQIGLVQQEPFSFNDTIFNNVAYGLVGSKWENEDIETKLTLVKEACKEAFADEFIDKLPMVSRVSFAIMVRD
jgi:ABC-type multidrug transport system fused ATPase/permease subunit